MPTLRELRTSRIVTNPKIRDIHLVRRVKGLVVQDVFLSSKVSEIKALLAEHGIDDLSKMGKLEISENTIATRGLLKPDLTEAFTLSQRLVKNVELLDRPTAGRSVSHQRTRLESLWARPYRAIPIERNYPNLFRHTRSTRSRRVDELDVAVWVGDEIVIHNDVTVLFTSQASMLIIIANTLRIGRSVEFAHDTPDFDFDNSDIIPQKRKKRQNRVPNRENQRIHGVHGDPGVDGRHGQHGANAPTFELFVARFEGNTPSFYFSGQDGQDGQQGQQGQDGQDGARGSAAKAGNKIFARCERRSGSGGNGGDGGSGGDGGDGGNGGDGGQVTFYLTDDAQQSLIRGFSVSLDPGRGGSPGSGGPGGRGGSGGALGRSASTGILGNTSCGAPPNRTAGRDGRDEDDDGRKGDPGDEGTSFENGNVRFVTVDEDTIRIQLNSPIITGFSQYQAKVGDSISINGRNLPSNLKVKFNDVEAAPNSTTAERVSVTVPDVEGGTVDVMVTYDNGRKETNVITLKVLPEIHSVTQGGNTPSRFVPGKPILIHGTGLSSDLILMVNGRPSPDIDFISENELEVELIRPFENDEFPNALGEQVSLQLIANEPGFASNEFPLILDTFRVLIVGDSIVWGQGLQDHEKFRNQLLDELRERKSRKGIYPEMHAHSGATIGYDMEQSSESQMVPDDTNLPPLHGEVPTSYPTILQQMQIQLDGQSTDETIDLIVTDGGINDVSISQILHPLTKDEDLINSIDFHCYRGAKQMLQDMVTQFPNAKIIYTGYFKILSDDTEFGAIDYLLTAIGFKIAGIGGAVGGYAINQVVRKEIIKHCGIFADRAHAGIRLAIDEVKNENGLNADHITFVDPEYNDQNAALASDSLLFGIGIPSMKPMDNDVIAVPRVAQCALNADRTNVWLCERASTGHPTPEGAEQYYLKILEALDTIVPVE